MDLMVATRRDWIGTPRKPRCSGSWLTLSSNVNTFDGALGILSRCVSPVSTVCLYCVCVAHSVSWLKLSRRTSCLCLILILQRCMSRMSLCTTLCTCGSRCTLSLFASLSPSVKITSCVMQFSKHAHGTAQRSHVLFCCIRALLPS